jgi:uncharacterized metal-binding protein
MSTISNKVKVIPCSGVGKVFGLVARETALKVVSELCSDEADTMCLAYLMTGDQGAREQIEGHPCITVDGCAKMCAAKNVKLAGGDIKEEFKVVEAFKQHKGAQAGSATALTNEGWVITGEIADKVVAAVKKLKGDE